MDVENGPTDMPDESEDIIIRAGDFSVTYPTQMCPKCNDRVQGLITVYGKDKYFSDPETVPDYAGCHKCFDEMLASNPMAKLFFELYQSTAERHNESISMHMNEMNFQWVEASNLNKSSPRQPHEIRPEELKKWPYQPEGGRQRAGTRCQAESGRFRDVFFSTVGRPPTASEYWAMAETSWSRANTSSTKDES